MQNNLRSVERSELERNVIKQMVNDIACTTELWMHLGGLLSTQEAIASCDSYASFVLSNLPRASITL